MTPSATTLGLSLRATDTRNGNVLDRTIDRFPLRVGRSALNGLHLEFSFISHFHAVIERTGERFLLRDLGSRNGVTVAGNQLKPHQTVDLSTVGFAFAIGPVQFQLAPTPVRPVAADNQTNVMMAVAEGAPNATQVWQALVEGPPQQQQRDPAQVALAGLRQLASYFQVGKLEDAESVMRFLNKMKQSLDLLFAVVVPLREGTRQFQRHLNVRGGSASAGAVAEAKRPIDIATLVLNLQDPSVDALRVLEEIFADFVVHQLAMVDATMRGVEGLLDELSPAAIEAEATKRGGGWFGKSKALWNVFRERHRNLADKDGDAFTVTFGEEFAQGYKEFSNNAARPSIVPQKKTS